MAAKTLYTFIVTKTTPNGVENVTMKSEDLPTMLKEIAYMFLPSQPRETHHPRQEPRQQAPRQQDQQAPRQQATGGEICRFGIMCNKKSTCPYTHPTPPECKFGTKCNREDCYFRHPTK